MVQRGQIEPGEAAGVRARALADERELVHAAEHLPVDGLGDRDAIGVQ